MKKIEVITTINGVNKCRTVKDGGTLQAAEEYAELITLKGPAEYAAVIVDGVTIAEYET